MPENDDPYQELGRRICAAIISHQLNLKSVDWALKHYVNGPVSPVWGQIGHMLQTSALEPLWERLRAVKALEASGSSDKPVQ